MARTFWNCSAKLSRTDRPGNAQGQRSADTESDVNFADLRLLADAAEVWLKYLNFALAYAAEEGICKECIELHLAEEVLRRVCQLPDSLHLLHNTCC